MSFGQVCVLHHTGARPGELHHLASAGLNRALHDATVHGISRATELL
jgi:hypothetical protein